MIRNMSSRPKCNIRSIIGRWGWLKSQIDPSQKISSLQKHFNPPRFGHEAHRGPRIDFYKENDTDYPSIRFGGSITFRSHSRNAFIIKMEISGAPMGTAGKPIHTSGVPMVTAGVPKGNRAPVKRRGFPRLRNFVRSGYSTLIVMLLGFSSSRFGRRIMSTPSLWEALTFSTSTEEGRARLL